MPETEEGSDDRGVRQSGKSEGGSTIFWTFYWGFPEFLTAPAPVPFGSFINSWALARFAASHSALSWAAQSGQMPWVNSTSVRLARK